MPKPLLTVLAIIFASAMVLYSVLWMSTNRWQSPVELGFDNEYIESDHSQLVQKIQPDSPAERAGMKVQDRIVAINGQRIKNANYLVDVWNAHKPGDSVELTVLRPDVDVPLTLHGVFRAPRSASSEGGFAVQLGEDIGNTYPVAFLVVGLAVLFLRIEDPYAWLLALMFAGFIAVPPVYSGLPAMRPAFRPFVAAFRTVFDGLISALFYFFFAVFPARSPLDRRAPWLKWMGLAMGLCWASSLGSGTGDPHPPQMLTRLIGDRTATNIRLAYAYGFIPLGLAALVANAFLACTTDARRKSRVLLWGTLVGVLPATLTLAAVDLYAYHESLLVGTVIIVLLWLFPISFAYAVVKHRVLEIPVLLKRSARYLLVQRGFVFLQLLVSIAATAVFASGFLLARVHLPAPMQVTAGVLFGSALAVVGLRVHKSTAERVDCAFFRNAYDARMILEDLVDKTLIATDRKGLSDLLEHHLNRALQPAFLAVYLEIRDGELACAGGNVPPELATIPSTLPFLAELRRHARPQEVAEERLSGQPDRFPLAQLHPDCLVPILGRDSRLVGLLVLGPRRSEESYSREDKHLLALIAAQAGVALETMRLGEKIAERIEAERRAAQEMEYAKQVQARLFPQKLPALQTLEYLGGCIQARQVGGDYYDFLELRPGRVALVLADIAGKGISGALLMANLQANLRGQYAMALEDLPRLLSSVNQLFYENTSDSSYATLFFADFDDSTRWLRYVNCGHLPPILLRADGKLEHLGATATVLGLFEKWQCQTAEVTLSPGDLLVLYTDGVTEAASSDGEEFGEERLTTTLRAHRQLPVASLLPAIVSEVQNFAGGEQGDDITLVVAKGR